MKIYFDYPLIKKPWGGGAHFLVNFANFLKEKGHKIVLKLKKDIDLIFISNNTKQIDSKIINYKKKNPKTKVLHRINECDKRKNTNHVDNLVFKKNELADQTIFISKWLAEYYIKKGFNKEYSVIYNGCNSKYFYPKIDKRLGDQVKLVTHHWSSHWLKGFDIYTKLDEILPDLKNITFTYIGRYNQQYKPKNTKLIPPLYGIKLGEELRKHDLYLTASRWEPCGMHHIEGASCGLPVLYHIDGGGINELCKNYGLNYHDIDTLLKSITQIIKSYPEYHKKIQYDFLSSERCNMEFFREIVDLCK
ncbi:MAG: glycosyltransferase [Candidatus Hodarchaeota archaeon]